MPEHAVDNIKFKLVGLEKNHTRKYVAQIMVMSTGKHRTMDLKELVNDRDIMDDLNKKDRKNSLPP